MAILHHILQPDDCNQERVGLDMFTLKTEVADTLQVAVDLVAEVWDDFGKPRVMVSWSMVHSPLLSESSICVQHMGLVIAHGSCLWGSQCFADDLVELQNESASLQHQ